MTFEPKEAFHLGEWLVVPKLHRLRRGAEERPLEPKVMQVLVFLASRHGEVVGHEDLIEHVWDGMAVSSNVVTYSIAALRKALEDDWRAPRYIETISKSGYRLIMPIRTEAETEVVPVATIPEGSRGAAAVEEAIPKGRVTPMPLAAPAEAARTRSRLPRRGWLIAGAAGAIGALSIVGAARVLIEPLDREALLLNPVPVTSFPGSEVQPTLSPDGNHIAFAWMKPGRPDRDLYVMLVGADTPAPLATSDDHERSPAWTPDGLHVIYARWKTDGSGCGIYKIPAVGGSSERIAECPGRPIGNMSVSPDGRLLAVGALGPVGEPAQIYVIDLSEGVATLVGNPPADRQGDYYPMFSPDGSRISFQRFRGDGLSDVYTVAADGTGLSRVTFDNRDVGGTDWSADGSALFFSSYRAGRYTLWRVPATGGDPAPVAINDHNIISPSLSRSGNRIAYSKAITDVNLWSTRLRGEGTALTPPLAVTAEQSATADFWTDHDEPQKLLSSTLWEGHPEISPDGTRLAFVSDRSGSFEVYSAGIDGSDLRRHTSFGGPFVGSPRWSPDGSQIVFDARPEGHADLWTVNRESATPQRLTADPDDEFAGSYSADGAFVYFTSHRSGSWQVWRMPAGGGEARQVTEAGGYAAIEGPGGAFLYYAKYDRAGIWRLPLDRPGDEEQVFPGLDILDWGSWTVRDDGIWAIARSAGAIIRYHPETGEMTPVVPLGAAAPRQTPSLSISADGRLLVWAQVDLEEDDIYLAEGLRDF